MCLSFNEKDSESRFHIGVHVEPPIWNLLSLSFRFSFLQQITPHLFTVITLDLWGHAAQSVTTHHQVYKIKNQKNHKRIKRGRARFPDVFRPRQLFCASLPVPKQGRMYSCFKRFYFVKSWFSVRGEMRRGVGCNETGSGVKTDPLWTHAALMCV